jgi:hypothetical protein
MWTITKQSQAHNLTGVVFVDNVDNLFLSYPHDPQRQGGFLAERKRQGRKAGFVGHVDNVDTPFSVATPPRCIFTTLSIYTVFSSNHTYIQKHYPHDPQSPFSPMFIRLSLWVI